jgi:hypothetical protein
VRTPLGKLSPGIETVTKPYAGNHLSPVQFRVATGEDLPARWRGRAELPTGEMVCLGPSGKHLCDLHLQGKGKSVSQILRNDQERACEFSPKDGMNRGRAWMMAWLLIKGVRVAPASG